MEAELKVDGSIELKIEREFAHPPEKVFEAWLQPEQVTQWMGPNDDINVSHAEIDAVEGGSYQIQFDIPDSESKKVKGIYKKIQRYSQLIFTWQWEPSTDNPVTTETLVNINFEATDTGTKLSLLHQKFISEDARDHHKFGWIGTLDKLERRAKQLFN